MASKLLKTANRTLNVLHKGSRISSIQRVRSNSTWTKEGILKSPYQRVEYPSCTLHEFIWQNLDKWPKKTLAVCAETGREYTYEQAYNLSNNFAANLRNKLKIRDGDTVMIMLPNLPEFPVVALGILGAGGVISTINPIFTAHEVQRQLLMSDAKVIVTLPETVNVVKEALKMAKLDMPIIVVKTNNNSIPEGTIAFNELSEDSNVDKSCLKEVRRDPNDTCFLPYSSGTTGLPKGVELTSQGIVANCVQINEPAIRLHRDTTANYQDVLMAVLPFFHIYGAAVLMFHKMSLGIKLVTLRKLQPDIYLKGLQKFKVNMLYVAPPLVLLMSNHPLASPKIYQYLEHVINGAAPMASSDAEKFLNKIERKIRFGQGYGLTETGPVLSLAHKTLENYDSVGFPVPNTEFMIVDDTLKPVGPNNTGEILVRGPQIMRGYRNNPEANAEVLLKDGWFRTGDLGIADEDGTLQIRDRLKELIKVKGFQVPPAELEALLREHPAVTDAAVVGVPHPTKGESPKAFVVLRSGLDVSPKDICNFVEDKVAPYKRIDDVVMVDIIPRNPSGKVLRKDLKAKYC